MYSLADALIRPAAADIARHRVIDLGVGWIRIFAQQDGGGHDLPRLAVAALRHVLGDPGPLQGVAEIVRETLNSRDFFARGAQDRRDARPHRLAIEVDGTRAAQRHAAAELCPGQPERFPQHP